MPVDSAPKDCLLQLPIGAAIQVTSEDKSLQYITHLVGIDGEKTIISNIPTMKQLHKENAVFDDIFYPERPLIMRILASGLVYAFETSIINIHHGNSRLLLSSYPATIQQRNLRREARYPCTLATSIIIGKEKFSGVVTNINHGGCQFCTSQDNQSFQQAKKDETLISIEILFPAAEQSTKISAKICSFHTEHDTCKLGIAFEKENTDINRYIDSLHLESVNDFFS